MPNYQEAKVKLTNWQLNKIKSASKKLSRWRICHMNYI